MDAPLPIRRRYNSIEKHFVFLQEWVYVNMSDSKEQYMRNVCIGMSNWYIMEYKCGSPKGYGPLPEIFYKMYKDRLVHYWESNENILI